MIPAGMDTSYFLKREGRTLAAASFASSPTFTDTYTTSRYRTPPEPISRIGPIGGYKRESTKIGDYDATPQSRIVDDAVPPPPPSTVPTAAVIEMAAAMRSEAERFYNDVGPGVGANVPKFAEWTPVEFVNGWTPGGWTYIIKVRVKAAEYVMLRIFVTDSEGARLTHMIKGANADGPARYFRSDPLIRECVQ